MMDKAIPSSCVRLDGKYCFNAERCPVFSNAHFAARRTEGTYGRLEGCPLSNKGENENECVSDGKQA